MKSKTKLITLYHTTNLKSAERMRLHGIGLTKADYRLIYEEVKDYFNVPDSELMRVGLPEFSSTYPCSASFWPTIEQAMACRHLGLIGGELKGLYVKALVTRAARFMGKPYRELAEVTERVTGGSTGAVVVVSEVPASLLANPEVVGTRYEHITKNKVPADCIRRVICL